MRLDELYQKLLQDQLDYYDRMYTISSGVENGWSKPLVETRREFIDKRFNILKKPFVEGIPRYHKEEGWTWSKLSEGFSGKDKQELDELAELLESYAEWTPYPHQIESIRQWQQGKHIVVATGTGSGKTECFLYPMLGQLLREARRAKSKGKIMERGIKTLILYPMNALVADQTVRIRDLFGGLDMAERLAQKGAGRFCQFGMYTGRTQAHGWYSEPSTTPGKWKLKTNGPRDKVRNIVKAYRDIERGHPELWERLVRDRRVPAKGNDELWSLGSFADGITDKSFNCSEKSLKFLGTKGDRELFSRYEMHQGGLIQYAFNSSEPSDEQREKFGQLTEHLGVPDILVTNYSMLEYMLLRPLEHVFWEDTKNWLHGELESGEDPRKLMLVLDEAHLYQGAMGTEVSMLINRLRSVLSKDGKNPEIQVIITSASLGKEEELKKQFVADLTGIDTADVAVPEPEKTNLLKGKKWSDLEDRFNVLNDLRKCDATTVKMEKGEFDFLSSICKDSSLMEKLSRHYNEGGSQYQRMEIRHDILHDSDIFIALYTALQHPKLIPEKLHSLRPNGDSTAPWELSKLSKLLTGQNDEEALSRMLDLVAGSRKGKTSTKTGMPLMPIRGHIFSRGLPRLSVCPRCSSFHKLETLRCDSKLSNGETCNARPFELVYGRSTGVAFLNLWVERLDSGEDRDGLTVSNKTQFVWSSPIGGSRKTRRVGLASWRCTKDKNYTHILDMDKGSIIPRNSFDHSNFDEFRHCYVAIAGFSSGSFESKSLWSNPRNKGKDNEFFDSRCPETGRNHSRKWARQVSNLETRGNEAFSGLIDGLLQLQDSVLESSHLPNGGKKCLIFSDSRQQAANVAVELGQLSNHDEARRLLFQMLHQEWFDSLESKHKSLAGIYPWYTLFCASKGINAFAGGSYSDDRSLFTAASINTLASILAAHAMEFSGGEEIIFGVNKDKVISLINSVKPKHGNEFNFDNLEFFQRAKNVIDSINSQMTYNKNPKKSEIKLNAMLNELLEHVKSAKSIDEIEKSKGILVNEIKKYEDSSWGEYKDSLDAAKEIFDKSLTEKITWGNFYGAFYRIKQVITFDWLLSTSDLVPLYQKCIDLISNSDVMEFIDEWNYYQTPSKYLPIHQKESGRWTDSWAIFINKVTLDGEYGIEEIGIGYCQINDEYWDKIDPKIREKLPEARYLIPRFFAHSFNRSVSKSGCLRDAIFSDARMPALNPLTIGRDNPYSNEPPGAKDIVTCEMFIEKLYKSQIEVNDFALKKMIDNLGSHSIISSSYSSVGINAEAIEIVPKISGQLRICENCYRPRLTPKLEDKTKCGSCGKEVFIDSSSSEFSNRFKSLRIDSWRRSIQELVDGGNAFLVRAEEHTAQIGDKLDDSDLYSPAELHELQFQDLPVPDSTSVINSRSSLPPIDVLSCTTTMEVGIDIGSLTCVALRSMPPHSANYQQRIGRAGRGSSEVSVALTWADNSAYAQQLFEEPERLLHHPESPPLLYMNNRRIQQRHFHASLLQLFMKHRPYVRDLLIFEGMADKNKAVTPNMVESLGMTEQFFGNLEHPYGFEAFRKWAQKFVDKDFIRAHFANNDSDAELFLGWKDQFLKRMNNYRKEVLTHGN